MARTPAEQATAGRSLRRSRRAAKKSKPEAVSAATVELLPAAEPGKGPAPSSDLQPDDDLEPDYDREYFDLYYLAPIAYARLDPFGVIEQINAAGCALFRAGLGDLLA